MSEIKIQTITPVHIGSGEELQYGTDFSPEREGNDCYISIIDPRKVFDIIGEERLSNWIAAINKKETTKSVVNRFAPNTKWQDYSKRRIMEWTGTKQNDTLKENIHDGRGYPYIPGSSIKGAIRTAVLATLAREQNGLENYIRNTKGKITAKPIESHFFGEDPSKDIFRFLQIGDAYFVKSYYEVAIRMVNINERLKKSYFDKSKAQLIEALGPDNNSTFKMKFNSDGIRVAKGFAKNLPDCMKSTTNLFKTINNHTRQLLESEIDYWQEKNDDDVDRYIKKIDEILQSLKKCNEGKECILRIGHGSGWRFITGAWSEDFNNFRHEIVPEIRRPNNIYSQYDFPKSRRIEEEFELLGFVKLTIS